MKYVDEFRDPALAKTLIRQINNTLDDLPERQQPLKFMEFCGGHTHTIFHYGLAQMLPERIELVHGPGCPVCVLPMGRVDDCIALASRPGTIFTTFGDAIRVPGSDGSLLDHKARGADVRIVYSPMDALALARTNPDREVVFYAIGFETTMPATALTVLQAQRENITNFSIFCNHITTVPTIKAILDSPQMQLDGFLAPGHVSMVVGETPLRFVAEHYNRPIVISGFEPLDILQSIWMLVRQLAGGTCMLENQYARIVASAGNQPGLEAMMSVFELREFFEWRGLGSIDHSGVRLTPEFRQFDAEVRFKLPGISVADPRSCQCGEVLKGVIRPWQCKVFGQACTPDTPLGALMVSTEGACAAYYKFGDLDDLYQQQQIPASSHEDTVDASFSS